MDRREQLRELIATLPERERRVVVLRMAGKTYREIGAEMGIYWTRAWALMKKACERMKAAA